MTDRFVTRREFARSLTAVTTLAIGSRAVAAADEPAATQDAVPQQPGDPPNPTAELPPPEVEDFLLAALLSQYPGDHLTPEMLAGIRADLRNHRRQAEQLRSVPLDNSDEPATILRAWRKE